MISPVQDWVRAIAALGPDAAVEVRKEAHCPDPSCPLRRTVIIWTDAAGTTHRTFLVKPLAYVRRPDVERALRIYSASR